MSHEEGNKVLLNLGFKICKLFMQLFNESGMLYLKAISYINSKKPQPFVTNTVLITSTVMKVLFISGTMGMGPHKSNLCRESK